MGNSNIKMCWIDLETTGLSAQNDVPLEVGLKLTDHEGYIFAEASWLVWEPNREYADAVASMIPFVVDMHTKSGLIDDMKGGNTRFGVEKRMIEFLEENDALDLALPLAGSSIGSLDRPFLLQHFPTFNTAISYRNIDISTLKELCKMNNPTLYERIVPIIGGKEDSAHRVLSDIDASILEYRTYRDNFLFLED